MPDIAQTTASDEADVVDFAETHDVSVDAARELIERYGADSEALDAALRNRTAH